MQSEGKGARVRLVNNTQRQGVEVDTSGSPQLKRRIARELMVRLGTCRELRWPPIDRPVLDTNKRRALCLPGGIRIGWNSRVKKRHFSCSFFLFFRDRFCACMSMFVLRDDAVTPPFIPDSPDSAAA